MNTDGHRASAPQALVCRARLFGLREVGGAGAARPHRAHRHGRPFRRRARADRRSRRDARRPEAPYERKFFPGYVLVQIATHDEAGIPRIDSESWHLIKETPKVMGFIGGTADKPLPIKDEEADAILQRVQDGVEKPRPKVLFEPGQMVRVVDGPFNDFNGVVEEVNYDKSRVRVAVLIFGRSTPVELEFGQVEKA